MALVIEGQADFSQAQLSIDDFSKKSRIALTNLSLVVQDLPYGFIGIQNNLPALTQSFAQLSAEAGGTQNAIKQLVSGLAGPAGLFLAFSAVTSAVTFAVQKYGSLTNAINVLFSSNSKLTQSQQELNKESARLVANTIEEEVKIKLLQKTINDSLQPMRQRQNAYIALKKIAPEIANGIGKENQLTAENIRLINENISKRIEYIRLRARENAILNIVNKNEEERITLEQQYPALLAKKQQAEKRYNETRGLTFDATKTFNAGLDQEAINFESATKALENNAAQRRNLYKINNDLVNQLEPLIKGISDYDGETQRFTETLKKAKKPLEDYKKGWQGIIDELERIRKQKFASISAANEFNVDQTFKRIAEEAKKATIEQEKYRKGMEGIISALQQRDSFKMEDPFPFDWVARFEENVAGIQRVIDQTNAVAFMKQNFTDPMSELFLGFIETGKFAFEEFGKVVLKTINQIVAKIIATGIINLLGSILFPGAVGGTKGVLGAFIGAFNSVLGFGGAGVANPSFVGVGGGTFGLSGQVNLVLRGQDLVGSLNRTNTLINRVG